MPWRPARSRPWSSRFGVHLIQVTERRTVPADRAPDARGGAEPAREEADEAYRQLGSGPARQGLRSEMRDLPRAADTGDGGRRHRARKRFGQHFRPMSGVIDAIVRDRARARRCVVEIGPGWER